MNSPKATATGATAVALARSDFASESIDERNSVPSATVPSQLASHTRAGSAKVGRARVALGSLAGRLGAAGKSTLFFLFPFKARLQPSRDEYDDELKRLEIQRAVVRGSFAWLPLAGVLAICVNLLIQFNGSAQLAIAVVQRLSVSGLVFIVAINLVVYIIMGLAIGLARVVGDRTYAPHVRQTAVAIQIAAIVLCGFAMSMFGTALILLTVYIGWRLKRSSKTVTPKTSSADPYGWFKQSHVPVDFELRALWVEGRMALVGEGYKLRPSLGDNLKKEPRPRPIAEVNAAAASRSQKIASASQKKNALNAVFAVCMGIVASYGLVVIAAPIRFAPLERVTIAGVDGPMTGFLLGESHAPSLFLQLQPTYAIPIDTGDVIERQICQPKTEWNSITLMEFIRPLQREVVDCPR